MLKAFFEVMIEELRRVFRIEDVFEVLIIGACAYFFFYPLPYDNEEVRDVPIAVMDQDNSTMSRHFLRMVDASDSLKVAEHVENLGEGKELLKQRKVYGILVIPFNFEQNILQGHKDAAVFYGDASYVMIYNASSTAIASIVSKMNQEILTNKQIQMGVDASVAKGNSLPYTPVQVELFNPQVGYATYVIPPAFMLIVHQLVWLSIMLACVFSRNSRFDYQLVHSSQMSLGRLSFVTLFGKYAAYLLCGSIMFWIYLLFASYWYDLPQLGSIPALVVMSTLFLSAVIFMALAMASLFKSPDSVFLLVLPVSMILFFIAGLSWPHYLMPDIIGMMARLVPSTSTLDGIVRVNQMGASLHHVLPEIANLATLIVIYGLLAYFVVYRYVVKLKGMTSCPQAKDKA